MQINSSQRNQLLQAIISAYPSKADLEMMIDFGLEENLDAIAGGENYRQVVYKLIKWAEASGQLEKLIVAACNYNPGNEKLKDIKQKLVPSTDEVKLQRQRQQSAERIKQLELQKQREQEEYENKLRDYEQEFSQAVEGEYPLSEDVRNFLNSLQQSNGLRNEDVAQIEQPILAIAEAKYQEKLKEEEAQRQRLPPEVELLSEIEVRYTQEEEIKSHATAPSSTPAPSAQPSAPSLPSQKRESNDSQKLRQSSSPSLVSSEPTRSPPWNLIGLGGVAVSALLVVILNLPNNKPTETVTTASSPSPLTTPTSTSSPRIHSNLPSLQPTETESIQPSPSPAPTSTPSPQAASTVSSKYTKLENLLAAKNWKAADKETYNVMLKIAGKESEGWLDLDSLKNFDCDNLRTINSLWLNHSNGKFGFSVQKDIWISVGGTPGEDDWDIYTKFAEANGWMVARGRYLKDLTFNTNAPRGHLPARVALKNGRLGLYVLFSRCEL